MTMWLPELDGRKRPVYRAIADAIDEDVQKGALRAGARLPPHRDLADRLGVTVTTITRAYTEATRRGLIAGHVGRGTFIRGTAQTEDEPQDGPLDLSMNILMPDKEVAILEKHLFARRVLPWTQLLGYVPSRGHLRHRQAMSTWLSTCGFTADPERIVLTAGAQHAMAVAVAAVAKPGDTLLVEDLTYSGARLLAQQMGLKLRGIAMDAEGLRPDALEAAIRSTRARVLYCMPRLQNPTSAVMSERRRRQIAAIADKQRLVVIEDDTYGFLSPEREPLASILPERTIFITSLSKSLFPGLRLGCAVPPASLVDKVTTAVWATMINTSPIGADIMSSWIEDGRVEAARGRCAPADGAASPAGRAASDAAIEPAHLAPAAGQMGLRLVYHSRPLARRHRERGPRVLRRGCTAACRAALYRNTAHQGRARNGTRTRCRSAQGSRTRSAGVRVALSGRPRASLVPC
jgi:DNA-binding transcriptional MocR family regulator